MSSSPQSRLANRIYLAASALGGEERKRYLDGHCPDFDVRQLVEELLAADQPATLETGSRLGHYQILAKLGAGGMGCVYEAQDSRLNRVVAIKVLPPDRQSGAPNPLAREAQAASALNHPNIVTVYEIGREGATEFIVMERIAGQTLARMIGSHGIELREALRMAAQVADALAAAHEAGIVHRDLKPGNVMVTERGLVKVLDFGLAKRMAVDSASDQNPTATMTKPGQVFGTVAYMSPEQAQGVQVDARSDIFSFGCLLYEMVTGQRAFHEEGELLTLAAVVGKEPRPANELKPGLPPALERIIEICLRKKRIDRWQNMGDIKLLLGDALQDLANPAAAESARRRSWLAIPLATLAGAAIAGGVFWTIARKPPEIVSAPVLRRVTMDAGLSAFPALSRAGNLLAFASDRGNRGNLDIWIQQIGGREPIQLTRDDADDSDPHISPDGTRVAYRSDRAGGGIYVVPALGGEEVLLAPGGRNPQFSPDGKWIAYWEGRELGGYLPGSARVFVIEAGGGQPRQVGAEMPAALYPVWSPKADSLLVLGRRDADANLEETMDWWVLPLEKGPARRTGALAQFRKQGLVRPAWEIRILPLAWNADGRNRVLFAAGPADAAGSGDVGNLWEIELPPGDEVRGPAIPLTSGPGYHLQASISPVSGRDRMAFTNFEWKVGVWEAPLDAERGQLHGEFRTITGQESFVGAPSLSRDGRILAFVSRRLGRWGLHTRDLSSGKEITLVSSGLAISLVSGDGNTVVYCDPTGSIYAVPRSGGKVDKLCDRCGSPMGMSFDGKRIAYEPIESEDLTVLDATQRKSVILASRPANTVLSGGRFSPDEKWIAFHEIRTRLGTTQIWIARIDGKLPVPQSDWIALGDGQSEERDPVWSPGGSLLYFLSERDGFRCVWARKLDPSTRHPVGEAFAVAHFHSARRSLKRSPGGAKMIGLSVAPGRMMLAFGELTGNIWLEEKPR
jgi:Tol biopolymer transport system component